MRRRDFLGTGLLGAAALGSGDVQAEEPLSDAQLERDLKKLRRELRRVQRLDMPALAGARVQVGEQRAAELTQLFRSSMRTLLVASGVGQLPKASREDVRVDALIREHSAEMDFAVFGMLDHLETVPQSRVDYVQQAIREEPELLDAAAETLDTAAREGGIRPEARRHLGALVRQVTWRMRRQPTAMIIEESTRKTQSLLETLAANVPETGLEATPDEQSKWGEMALSASAEGGSIGDLLPEPGDKSGQAMMRRAGFRLAISGGCLIIGLGFGALSFVLSESAIPDLAIVTVAVSLVLLTAAVVMLIVGLVTLIVAAARMANEPPPEELPSE